MGDNPHIGSSLENFLTEDDRLEEATDTAIKRLQTMGDDEEPDVITQAKADLAAAIERALIRLELTDAAAAQKAGVDEADIRRIHQGDLGRFIVDDLVRVVTRIDPNIRVEVRFGDRPGPEHAEE